MRPKNISAATAKNYYYEKDPVFEKNNEWQGLGAKELGLRGAIKKKDFAKLISGQDLQGNAIVQDGVNGEHRAGTDISFAPPKSVSIMALHVNDDRLIEAHHQAVHDTLEFIETNYLYARVTTEGQTRAEHTGSGVFAKFNHSTSRENDPQLHTHSIIVNLTNTERGWRATFNDEIFIDQKLINSVYQNKLALSIRKLGYEIVNTGTEKWEIGGVKEEWRETFSKRSGQIDEMEKELKDKGVLENAKDVQLRNMAVLKSRPEKDLAITKEELADLWQGQVPRERIKESVLQFGKDHAQEFKAPSANDIIQKAYKAIHDSESTFYKNNLFNVSLQLGRGYLDYDNVMKAFLKALKEEDIIHLDRYTNSVGIQKNIYTSQHMLNTEREIVRTFDLGKDSEFGYCDADAVKNLIDSKYAFLTDDQKTVVRDMLSSRDQFIIVQGDAGTGKTTALKSVKEIMDQLKPDTKIYGLGFTGKASFELTKKSGIESATVDSFLRRKAFSGDLVIVDEASMVGSYQFKSVLAIAKEKNLKVVFVGDGKQLQAISAGRMFKDLQDKGHVRPVRLGQVIRQKTEYMQQTVAHIKNFFDNQDPVGIDKAINILSDTGRTFTIQSDEDRMEAVIEQYIKSHQDTLIVTPLNRDREIYNNRIREEFKVQDLLPREDQTLDIRVPVALVGVDKFFAGNYEIGHKAFVLSEEAFQGLKPGEVLTIIEKDEIANTIKVKSGTDKVRVLPLEDVAEKISMYEEAQRDFCKGDKIVFLKNDRRMQVQNGVTGVIEKMDKTGNLFINVDGRTVQFNKKFYNYFDHGYCVTVHKAQGQTDGQVIFVTHSENEKFNTTESLYVSLSRCQRDAYLFCDNINTVTHQFKTRQEKTSTLDHVRQAPMMKVDIGRGNA